MWSSIRRRFEMPADLPKLSEELTRLFFGPVIDRRVAYLAGERGDQESSEDRRYFFEEARKTLQRQVRSHSQAWEFDRVRIKRTLTELDLATPAEFRRVLETAHSDRTWRGRFQKHPLARKRSAGVVLLAIQEAALAIIPEAYPGKGRPADEDLLSEISRLVQGVLVIADNLASGLQVDETLIPLGLALARLHLTQARAGHKIWLPVRPIPAAPLSREEVVDHYAGRDDRDALHLARQVRAGDGVILVTGYRGVGKSSFVNRVIHHVLEAQKELPRDGRLVVPVALNLAKASGVQSVLRLTLRAIRRSLLDEKNAAPLQVPGNGKVLLPLQQAERQAIQEAYLRATYKVAMSHQDTAERKWEFESALGLDAGKLLAPAAGWGF